jgi:hypothetical protein
MIYDKASLVQIPSGYKSGGVDNLYSVVPNTTDGDFDATRGSSATRVNKDGLIETVGDDTPRLDYPLLDGVVQDCPALLLEPLRRNIFTYSEDFSSDMSSLNSSVTTDDETSPKGDVSADKLTHTASSNARLGKTLTLTSGTKYSISFFVKKDDLRYFKVWASHTFGASASEEQVTFDLDNGSVQYVGSNNDSAEIIQYPNGWYRCEIVITAGSNIGYVVYFAFSDNTNAISVTGTEGSGYLFGGQVEDSGSGVDADYPTSYIPNLSTGTTTRSADVCNGAGTADTFNDSEGVLFAEISSLESDDNYVSLSDSTSSNRLVFGYDNSQFRVFKNGTNTFNTTSTPYDVRSLFNKIALKYSDNQGTVVYANGFLIDTGSDNLTTSGLSELAFDNGAGVQNFYGKTKQVMTFNEALSDTELENLTSWDSFREMATEQLYTIE